MKSSLKPIIFRSIVFVAVFLFVSALIGSWVIPTRLLYGSYFYTYGNMGKALIVFIVALSMLTKSKLSDLKVYPRDWIDSILIVAGVMLLPIVYTLHMSLLGYQEANQSLLLLVASHSLLVLLVTLIFLGCFGFFTIQSVLNVYRQQVVTSLLFSILTYFAIFQVWKLWPLLSRLVLNIVFVAIKPFVDYAEIEAPLYLTANNFSIIVGEACSGLDSMLMFTFLYIFMILSEIELINKTKAFLLFIPAFIGVFMLNILRVSLLVVIGALYSEDLAIGMFHTYAGMVLFLIYFFIFVSYFYKYIKVPVAR